MTPMVYGYRRARSRSGAATRARHSMRPPILCYRRFAVNITRVVGLLLVGLQMLIVGCKTDKWRADEFEGAWRLESVGGVPLQTGATDATFTLNHDGRFIAKSLPHGFLQLDDVKPDQLYSGAGTWSLSWKNSSREVRVSLIFRSVDGINVRHLPYGAELFIQGSKRDPRLFYFKGDPDENQRIVFRREPPRG